METSSTTILIVVVILLVSFMAFSVLATSAGGWLVMSGSKTGPKHNDNNNNNTNINPKNSTTNSPNSTITNNTNNPNTNNNKPNASPPAPPGCAGIVRHKLDTVVLAGVCISPTTGHLSRRYCAQRGAKEATFRLHKSPYYKSRCDGIVLGMSVQLEETTSGAKCHFEGPDKILVCGKKAKPPAAAVIRILDKHGKADKQVMRTDGEYVKFRRPGHPADCNDGLRNAAARTPTPMFHCVLDKDKKQVRDNTKYYYDFTIYGA
jgi:hypothetical protein